jgi:type II secretory pathway pseudopilin PulG
MKNIFFEVLEKRLRCKKYGGGAGGFNLIELGLVIMILAILMYTVIPTGELQDTAKLMSLAKKVQTVYTAAQSCMLAHGMYTYEPCADENTLVKYLPAAAKEDKEEFWKTPWDGKITLDTEYGGSSFKITIDLGQIPKDTDVSYGDRLAKFLQGSAKEIKPSDSKVEVIY